MKDFVSYENPFDIEGSIIPYHRPYPLSFEEIEWIQEKIKEILKSGQLTNGEWVKALESAIKQIYDVEYVITTSNCTLGITLCFQYLNWLQSIEIPNFTWISPYFMLYHRRFEYIDIDKESWLAQMDGEDRYNLYFPTHTFGNIIELKGCNCIYDGAHSLGSKIKEFGDATVLSLAPTKLVTSCEGGLILTNNNALAEVVEVKRDKCARMSEIHAIIGLATLKHLKEIKRWKKKLYNFYKKSIPGQFQKIPIDSNYNTIGFLNTENLIIPDHIETRQYYEPFLQSGNYCPNSIKVYKKMVCLPSYFNCNYKQIVEDIKEAND